MLNCIFLNAYNNYVCLFFYQRLFIKSYWYYIHIFIFPLLGYGCFYKDIIFPFRRVRASTKSGQI